jgi:hypothetical protein
VNVERGKWKNGNKIGVKSSWMEWRERERSEKKREGGRKRERGEKKRERKK